MLLRLSLAVLTSLLASVSLVKAAEPQPQPSGTSRVLRLKNLAEECSFKLGARSFDLCPVLNGNEGGWTVEFERRTPPTITKTSYKIDLQAPLKREDGLPDDEQCPDGTWICQTISNRRPHHEGEEPRVHQVVPVAGAMHRTNNTRYRPGVNITAQLAPARDNPKSQILHVRLHGGYYVYAPQKADIQFVCDSGIDEPSTPTFSWSWNGTHTFQWRTKHACGSQRAQPVEDEDTPPPPPEEDSGTDGEDDAPPQDDEGQELIGGSPISGHAKRTMILLLSSLTAVIMLVYLALRPPARVRQYMTRFMKAHPLLRRFRVGESVLVRWAHEDMEMEGEGEEDTMVNFAPEEVLGEGIPLKPSPRKGRWANYGTA